MPFFFLLLYILYINDKIILDLTAGALIELWQNNPHSSTLFYVKIFDNTPASRDGTLQSGDEIIGVDNVSVKGKTKSEVAKMIQGAQG